MILKTIHDVVCRCGGDSAARNIADAQFGRDIVTIRVVPRLPACSNRQHTPKADWIAETLVLQARNARDERLAANGKQQLCAAIRAGDANWRARKIAQAALPNPGRMCRSRDRSGASRSRFSTPKDSLESFGRSRGDTIWLDTWPRYGSEPGSRESAACGSPPRRAYRPQRSCGRVAEGGGLLNRYRVVKPYRGFESLRLRQIPI